MRVPIVVAIVDLATAVAAQEQGVVLGQTYQITIQRDVDRPFVGPIGEARLGAVAVQIKRAKIGERYAVTVSGIKRNPYTGLDQAVCTFRQIGGPRKGVCNTPPG